MKRKIGSSLFLLLLFFCWPVKAAAADYSIEAYKVDVSILENGTAVFDHAITYDFDGAFNGFLYTLDYAGYQQPTDIEVTVADENGRESQPFKLNSSQSPGTFTLSEGIDFLNFTVYQPGKNREKTVHYKYKVPEMIVNYLDTAEFNHKVIGGGWDDTLENVEIVIHLPQAVADKELKAWAHGTLTGSLDIKNNQTVHLTVASNPSHQFIEAHLVFPTYVTPLNPNTKDQKALASIMAQEQQLANEANAKRMRIFWVVIILSVLSVVSLIGGMVWIRILARKEKQEDIFLPTHLYELPADITPAVMYSATNNQKPRPVDLTATIMDLVRKKQIYLTEMNKKDKKGKEIKESTFLITRLPHSDTLSLLPHERYAMKWLLKVIGNGKEVSLQTIEDYGKKNPAKAKKFNEAYQKWQGMVKNKADELGYFSTYNARALGITVLTSVLLFATSLAALIVMGVSDAFYGWPLIITIGCFIISLFQWIGVLPLRTTAGKRADKEWKAFKKMLQDVSNLNMAEVASLVLWDHFLVYAISLGVSKKVIKALKIQFPKEDIGTMNVGHYYLYGSTFSSSAFQTSFESSFNHAVGHAINNASSGSGSGGGFSGGSSGGGGGGSGGGAF
ncbi:MAG: DUF2207 domain-containing protein [Carnobacterium sp.]|uniref:DUF2207 domain-containing protein n=1 Tax=Carnobacterium sp. TaxID=48221 RepID=UPI002FCBB94D